MVRNYQIGVDNEDTSPELIELRYQVGRSASFEVALALGEFANSISGLASSSLANSVTATPVFIQTQHSNGSCPAVGEFVLEVIGGHGTNQPVLKAIQVDELLSAKREIYLYHPLTKDACKVVCAAIVKNQPLVKVETLSGVANICSRSHKVITNTADALGQRIDRLAARNEILVMKETNRFSADFISSIEEAGNGDVIEISLETGFIYASGHEPDKFIVAHNLKAADVF